MRLSYSIILLLFFSLSIHAQNEKALKQADKKFKDFAYVDARQIYLDVAKSGYKSESLYKKLGDSYYFNNELTKSLEWYEKLYEYKKNLEPDYLFKYAMALKSVKKYKEADQILAEFHKQTGTTPAIEKKIQELSSEDILKMNANKYVIEKAPINSEFLDYAPTYYQSKLVFCSSRNEKTKPNKLDHEWNNQPFSDLYVVDLKRNNELGADVTLLDPNINTQYHESSSVFTKDGNTIYFSRNNYNDNKFKSNNKGVSLIKLYKSTKDSKGKWQKAVELSFNNDEYSVAHPALSLDEKRLYFSSDMPGTRGLSDLYFVEIYLDGTYSKPTNLGDQINTAGRESYPFITKNNQLIFSSDGHVGLGGFDVFFTQLNEDYSMGEITNMGNQINSPTDDFSLIIDTKDNTGFFASNRDNASGSDDIYQFKIVETTEPECKQEVKGIITDDIKGTPLSNVKIQLFDTNLKEVATSYTDAKGLYKFDVECNNQYIVRVAINGFKPSEQIVSTNQNNNQSRSLNFPVTKGNELGQLKYTVGDDIGSFLQLDKIHFNFDKSTIREDAAVELQKILIFLKQNKSVKLDIRSHTDSNGSLEYNEKLSERRAKSTADYLIQNGIERKRITYKGYAYNQLLNDCGPGVQCSDAQHQVNRRSEFIITNIHGEEIINTEIQTTKKSPIITSEKKIEKEIKPIEIKKSLSTYNFNGSDKKYTVQVAAMKNLDNLPFKLESSMFTHAYSDGYIRVFSGVFESKEEAKNHQLKLKQDQNLEGYILLLQGELRNGK